MINLIIGFAWLAIAFACLVIDDKNSIRYWALLTIANVYFVAQLIVDACEK